VAPFAVADASPHLAGLLDSQYETLLQEWADCASQSAHPAGLAREGELAAHVPALLRRLIDDLSKPEVAGAAGVLAPLAEGFDLESVVWGYGLLQHLVLELLERASVPVSMGDVRRLGDWFTRAIAAVVAAHAGGARSSSPGTRRRVPESSRDADTLRSVGQESTGDAQSAQASPVQVEGELLDSRELDGRRLEAEQLSTEQLEAERVQPKQLLAGASSEWHPVERQPLDGQRMPSSQRLAQPAASTRREVELVDERWRALLQQAPVAISVVRGPDFVYELANPLAQAMIGGRDIVGKTVREAFPELGADAPALRVLEQVYGSGQPFHADEYAIPLDRNGHGALEEVYFKFTCQPIRDASGQVRDLLTIALDVSAQVQARRRAEALLAELTLVDQRKNDFLAMLAHELRNPMAAINTSLILLDQADRDPAKSARYREIARRQMTNLVRLVDDLLDVARISRGKIELRQDDVELGAIVQHALGATRPVVEAHQHELRVTIAPGAFRLVGDGTRLEQVIVNLITNAAKYTDPGGTISVTLDRDTDHELRQDMSPASPWAKLSVYDTGRGIASDMLDKVFELFTQVSPGLDRRTGGLGLGLTLVKHLVEMHGGSVAAFSAGSGQGSEFRVRLPLSAEVSQEAWQPAPRLEPVSRRQRVLVVEDSDDVRELLEACIRELGHEVFGAANGPDGAAAIERERPEIALVDVGLPGIDGYEVARRARASRHGRDVRLIALSGYGGADFEKRARAAGFDVHVTKPIELERLRELLDGPASPPEASASSV
jgi:PAS domain S-box-containing protein